MSIPHPNDGSYSSVTMRQLRVLLDPCLLPTAILQWNKILYINPAGRTLLGKEQAEQVFSESILGWGEGNGWDGCKTDPSASEEGRRIRIQSLMRRKEQIAIPRKRWIRVQQRWVRQENRTLIVDVQAWPIPLAGGNGIQISFADITQAFQEEQSQQTAKEQLALAIDSANLGIWSYDRLTDTFHCSKPCKQLLGIAWDEDLSYASFLALVHPEDRPRFERTMQHSFSHENGGKYSCDFRIVRPDDEMRWIASKGRVGFATIHGSCNAVRLDGIVLDITDLRQTDAALREKEKLAAAGRLAACIAHEINNPLEAVTNLLYLLENSTLQTDQRQYIKSAQKEVDRIIDITKLTLRFYRDPGPPTQCDLPEIIESVLAMFANRIAGSNIRIERRYGKGPAIFGAREELRQVVMNLIQNALDAMPHGGRLLVRTRAGTQWPDGRKGLRITIADTGYGIDPGILTRIFEPFFTTHTTISTGLGLWLCAGAVQQHKGTIRVKSIQHHDRSGTVFSIFLPLDRRK